MIIDTTLLSRIQFGFTIGFHILFPTLNIGLAVFLSIMEGLWLKTANPVYLKICQFWTKIFALTFGMGVVTGIVLFLIKVVAYYLTDSVAIFTDALESTINVASSFLGLYALYLASIPRDKNHPYGHGKVEFFSAFVEGVVMFR